MNIACRIFAFTSLTFEVRASDAVMAMMIMAVEGFRVYSKARDTGGVGGVSRDVGYITGPFQVRPVRWLPFRATSAVSHTPPAHRNFKISRGLQKPHI